MTQRIQKAAVLGAGTMGARIAAHFANAGLPCLLLDIAPKDATPAERNKIVAAGLEAAKKAKPAAFFTPVWPAKVSIGNFEDDLARIADADWIIEVVAENLEIKRGLLAKWRNSANQERSSRRIPQACQFTSSPRDCRKNFSGIGRGHIFSIRRAI